MHNTKCPHDEGCSYAGLSAHDAERPYDERKICAGLNAYEAKSAANTINGAYDEEYFCAAKTNKGVYGNMDYEIISSQPGQIASANLQTNTMSYDPERIVSGKRSSISHSTQSAESAKIASATIVKSCTSQCNLATFQSIDDKIEKVPAQELLSAIKTSAVNNDDNSLPLANDSVSSMMGFNHLDPTKGVRTVRTVVNPATAAPCFTIHTYYYLHI